MSRGRLYASVTARRRFELGIRQLGRRFVRRGRRDQAHRGITVHPAPDDGDHGPACPRPSIRTSRTRAGANRNPRKGSRSRSRPPTRLPEAIAGRSYLVALAATGGRGPLRWSVEGTVPEWLSLDPTNGLLAGTPPQETAEPLTLGIGVSDGAETATQIAQLSILPFQAPSSAAAWLKRQLRTDRLARVAGTGYWISGPLAGPLARDEPSRQPRAGNYRRECRWPKGLEQPKFSFKKGLSTYRLFVRLTTLSAMIGMAIWLYLASAAVPLRRPGTRLVRSTRLAIIQTSIGSMKYRACRKTNCQFEQSCVAKTEASVARIN